MTEYPGLGQLMTAAGTAEVRHRLALAVEPVDGWTGRPASGERVSREARRFSSAAPVAALIRLAPVAGGGRYVVRHGLSVGASVRIRVDDPARRLVPRRFEVPLWTLAEVEACDPRPRKDPTRAFVPAMYRRLRPWLLPGPGYPVLARSTGARLVVRAAGGASVRWPRVEAFDADGRRVGWAHGDDRGQVLLLVSTPGGLLGPPPPPRFDVAVRVHWPDPERPAEPDGTSPHPLDPLADLCIEPVPRSEPPPNQPPQPPQPAQPPQPPQPVDLDNDVARGITVPPHYLTVAVDTVVTLTVGAVVVAPDVTVT